MNQQRIRDYKYIRNTLPSNVSRESEIEGLGIGKKVENLLPELNEENIGNGKDWEVADRVFGVLSTTIDLKPNTNYSIQIINRSIIRDLKYFCFKEEFTFQDVGEKIETFNFKSNGENFNGIKYVYGFSHPKLTNAIYFLKTIDGRNEEKQVFSAEGQVTDGGQYEYKWENDSYRYLFQYDSLSTFTTNYGEEYNLPDTLDTFFQTGSSEISLTINIPGLTSYFNLENARCWKSNIKPTAYLFETDSAWLVDKNGIIFGQSSEPFVYLGDISDTTLPIEYTDEYIKKVFKTITYENNTGQNKLKFTVSEEMKKIVESGEEIYLATYRDRLTSDAQVTWNKQKFLARYGRIGQISSGSRNQRFYVKNDKFKADILKSNYFSVNIQDKKLESHGDIVISFFPEGSTTTDEFNLALGSVLGYNRKYAQSYGQDMAQRFTSICFAWVRKKDGVYERISDYSRPVIIDRQLSNGWYLEDKEWVFKDNQTVEVYEYSALDNSLKGYGCSDGLYIILKQNINQ